MAKRLIFAFMYCLWSMPLLAQKQANAQIPPQIMQQFTQRYGNSPGVQWALANNRYEAQFSQSGVRKRVIFAQSGEWLALEQPIPNREIPQSVVQTLSRQYPGHSVLQAFRIERINREIGFRVRVRQNSGTWDVEVDAWGKVNQQVQIGTSDEAHNCRHPHGKKHKHKHKHKHKDQCHHHCRHDCEDDDD
jgi:hypothetical protein